MKNFAMLLAAGLFALVTADMAFAQSATGTSNSNSGAMSQSGVNIKYGNGHKQVGAAIAPGLIASGLSCQGSASVGAGGGGWGMAFGTTVMDRNCDTRENAKIVGLLGDSSASKEVMCNIKEVRNAYAAVGRPCLIDRQRAASTRNLPTRVSSAGYPIKGKKAKGASGWNDPYAIIRDR